MTKGWYRNPVKVEKFRGSRAHKKGWNKIMVAVSISPSILTGKELIFFFLSETTGISGGSDHWDCVKLSSLSVTAVSSIIKSRYGECMN
jgi:hypothetical protein